MSVNYEQTSSVGSLKSFTLLLEVRDDDFFAVELKAVFGDPSFGLSSDAVRPPVSEFFLRYLLRKVCSGVDDESLARVTVGKSGDYERDVLLGLSVGVDGDLVVAAIAWNDDARASL